jgi:hypothetical protein
MLRVRFDGRNYFLEDGFEIALKPDIAARFGDLSQAFAGCVSSGNAMTIDQRRTR